MEDQKKQIPVGQHRDRVKRDEGAGGEWIRFWICAVLTLTVGILLRVGILPVKTLEQALLDNAPQVSWREHTVETLARIGELFYGKNDVSG